MSCFYAVSTSGPLRRWWRRTGALFALIVAVLAVALGAASLAKYRELSQRVSALAHEVRPAWSTCGEWARLEVDDKVAAGEYLLTAARVGHGDQTTMKARPTNAQIARVVDATDRWCAAVDDDRLAARAVRSAYESDESLRP